MTDQTHRLMTRKADLGDTLLEAAPAIGDLAEGEVVLALDRFSLTTNNITYAAYGDARAFYERFFADQRAFFERVVDPAAPWIAIVEHRGLEAAAGVVRALADGQADAAEGAVVRI